MAGQNRRGRERKSSSSMVEKSLFSMINMFKFSMPKRSRDRDEVAHPEPHRSRGTWVSDEDRGRYVGEPDVDKKASDFITRFYENRMIADPERQRVVV